MSSALPTLICGAGVSGLCLAQGLLKAKIPSLLFERDPALNIRSQGYRFRILGPGILALREVLLPALYAEVENTCAYLAPGPVVHLNAITAEPTDGPGGAPIDQVPPLNTDRTVMRSVLSQGLEELIEYNKEFVRYEITSSGVKVSFSDGTQVQGCLLAGADGARSRIKRQLIPDDALLDTKGRFLFGKTAMTAEVSASFNKDALKGMTLVRDRSQNVPLTILLDPMHFTRSGSAVALPDDYIYWVVIAHIDRFGINDAKLLKL